MILVKLRGANAKCSAGKLLNTDLKADSLDVALEEERVEFAVGQESHVAAGDVELIKDVI